MARRRRGGKDAKSTSGGQRGRGFLVAGIVLMACALALFASVFLMDRLANVTDPADPDRVLSKGEAKKDADGFPKVDWDKWEKANPDIVGWVSVPGTRVSYPIVRAPKGDPDFYLHHDVRKRWNVYGAIYLDADSDAGLLDSDNSVVFGHHMNDGSMFAVLANFSDAGWARRHRKVLVQTRGHKVVYRMCSADIVNGLVERKFTDFDSGEAFAKWRDGVYAASGTKVGKLAGDRVLTLVTCSYHRFGNERTLAYCMPVKVDGKKVSGKAVRRALGATPAEEADQKRADEAAASAVEAEIDALSEYEEPPKAILEAVRRDYDGLSEAQKALVGNASELEEAEGEPETGDGEAAGEGENQ